MKSVDQKRILELLCLNWDRSQLRSLQGGFSGSLLLLAEGWQIRKIKVDGGCYEVYGTTPEDQRVEAYFDPVTLEKLLVSRRGITLFKKKVLFERSE